MKRDSQSLPHRFLIEVRGVLHVEATDGNTAEAQVDQWIANLGTGEAAPLPTEIRVGYLRIFPESEERPGWPQRQNKNTH